MKNHIAVKFIAVLLCAVSLLGAVGSGIGVFALTEMDLYDKTVDQVYEEQILLEGERLAHDAAMYYASGTLGGCPSPLVEQLYHSTYGWHRSGFQDFYYGYQLKDSEGNVLENRDIAYGENIQTYHFDVIGQYIHLVDTVTASDKTNALQESAHSDIPVLDSNDAILLDTIPNQGAVVSDIQITLGDSSYGAAGNNLGTVFRNQDGIVVLRCPGWSIDIGSQEEIVTAITLTGQDGYVIYDATSQSGVGTIGYTDADSGDLIFTSFRVLEEDAVEETVPEATVSEESIPETSADAETVPAETAAETDSEAEEVLESSDEEREEGIVSEETVPAENPEEAEASSSEDPEAAAEDSTNTTEAFTEPSVPETVIEETFPEETIPQETQPVLINGKPLKSYQINRTEYYDSSIGELVQARYVYLPMPEMTLELQVAPGALRSDSIYALLRIVRSFSSYLLPTMAICLLLFVVCGVYLCCAAGHTPKSNEIRAGGLNRLPLDLYGALTVMGVIGLCIVIAEGGDYLLQKNLNVGIFFITGLGLLASLLIVGFLFAFVAQIKAGNGFWWRNSLVGWCLKLCRWLFAKSMGLCILLKEQMEESSLIRGIWKWIKLTLKRSWIWIYAQFNRFLSLLPLTLQWILAGIFMILLVFVTTAGRYDIGIILSILFALALILYGSHCFGVLLEAVKKMSKGNWNSRANDKFMVGAFKEFAADLNDLSDAAVIAVEKQLKSERMKTDLITNVSHDIKTPLTSIINYVDLLQKPHTQEEQAQYLDVLDRQSQRLKKLVDDIMYMSKASSGNMPVDINLVDAVEAVNQALGEFADKLDQAKLIPVFRHIEDTVPMMADGKLVWRVLSNLLSNAIKYAMPGTRLYIDLMTMDSQVIISLKNISQGELNIDAEELMERFVRGDISRNTEGSGLGLNIAKSLMELQRGHLQLSVDGDLFKVTLIFPGL